MRTHRFLLGVLTALIIAAAGAPAVAQQTASPQGMPHQIGALQNQIAVLQEQLRVLIGLHVSNVRITPPLVKTERDEISCLVVNVSTVTRRVRAEVIRFFFDNVDVFADEIDLLPGEVFGVGDARRERSVEHCRFTVIDGSKEDIRGRIEMHVFADPNETTTAILAAE